MIKPSERIKEIHKEIPDRGCFAQDSFETDSRFEAILEYLDELKKELNDFGMI